MPKMKQNKFNEQVLGLKKVSVSQFKLHLCKVQIPTVRIKYCNQVKLLFFYYTPLTDRQ